MAIHSCINSNAVHHNAYPFVVHSSYFVMPCFFFSSWTIPWLAFSVGPKLPVATRLSVGHLRSAKRIEKTKRHRHKRHKRHKRHSDVMPMSWQWNFSDANFRVLLRGRDPWGPPCTISTSWQVVRNMRKVPVVLNGLLLQNHWKWTEQDWTTELWNAMYASFRHRHDVDHHVWFIPCIALFVLHICARLNSLWDREVSYAMRLLQRASVNVSTQSWLGPSNRRLTSAVTCNARTCTSPRQLGQRCHMTSRRRSLIETQSGEVHRRQIHAIHNGSEIFMNDSEWSSNSLNDL